MKSFETLCKFIFLFLLPYFKIENHRIILVKGISSSGKTFSICFAFLPNEGTESLTWALQQAKKYGIYPSIMVMDGTDGLKAAAENIFPLTPTLLCTWHVNKAVFAKCRGNFPTLETWNLFYKTWLNLIQSKSEDEYKEKLAQFQTKYNSGVTKSCINYIEGEWLRDGQKQRLVMAWTDRYRHFNITVTTRYDA